MDKIKAFILNPITTLIVWLALASVAVAIFVWGVVSGNWAMISLAAIDAAALILAFIAKF